MRRPLRLLAATLASLLLPLAVQAPSAQAATPTGAWSSEAPTARVIVKLKSGSTLLRSQALSAKAVARAEQMRSLGQRFGMSLATGRAIGERSQVVFASGVSSDQLAKTLSADPDVEYAEPDHRRHVLAVPNDPLYVASAANSPQSGQWYLRPPTTALPSSINAEGAWDLLAGNTATVVVAVLDTGVRFDHPDLGRVASGGSLLPGYDMIGTHDNSVSTANDGDARDADPSDPGDAVTAADKAAFPSIYGDCDVAMMPKSTWHGTETAGLVAALTNNGRGMASLSGPGHNLQVLPVRVLGKCGGFDSDIQAGMRWAAGLHVDGVPDNTTPAKVLNLSLGADGACTQAYLDTVKAVNAQGAVVVAAAGNSEGHAVGTPANCAGVIAVAGVRHTGTKVGFSDIGPEIAISAPGGNCVNNESPCLYPILSTTNSGVLTPKAADDVYTTDGANFSAGTSFSSPLVAGTVGLMMAAQPALKPADIKAILQRSARAFPTTGAGASVSQCRAPSASRPQDECYCTTATCGAGMLDTLAAVKASLVVPRIAELASAPVAGQPLTLTAAAPLLPAGVTVVGYKWSLVDGGGIVSGLTGDVNGASVSATPTGPGAFTVALQMTDSTGGTSTTTMTVTVPDAANPAPSDSGGGGGGSLGWMLLLPLALVAAATRRKSRLNA
ncbi:MAG: hypothetical protein JWP52_3940 [Rhizobacter sp.]|nr:hypothetical protein [Rhizobacter sp.]